MNGLLLAGGLKFEMSRMTGVNVVFYVRFVGIIDGAHAHKKELFQGVRLLWTKLIGHVPSPQLG